MVRRHRSRLFKRSPQRTLPPRLDDLSFTFRLSIRKSSEAQLDDWEGGALRHPHPSAATPSALRRLPTMKKLAVLAGLALTMGVGAFGAAHAATVQSYQQAAFDAAQKSG